MFSFLQKHATTYDIIPTEDNVNDIGTSKVTRSLVSSLCPSLVTGEESTRYILSSLETTKPVLVDTEGTTTLVRKISLISTTNPVPTLGLSRPILLLNAHTDSAFTDQALLGKRTITPKDYSKVKKKNKMNLVTFKKDQRCWTEDESEEDAEREDIHDGFPVCTNAACSDAFSDVMPSFLDITKRSLSLSMPLLDVTKL